MDDFKSGWLDRQAKRVDAETKELSDSFRRAAGLPQSELPTRKEGAILRNELAELRGMLEAAESKLAAVSKDLDATRKTICALRTLLGNCLEEYREAECKLIAAGLQKRPDSMEPYEKALNLREPEPCPHQQKLEALRAAHAQTLERLHVYDSGGFADAEALAQKYLELQSSLAARDARMKKLGAAEWAEKRARGWRSFAYAVNSHEMIAHRQFALDEADICEREAAQFRKEADCG